MVKKHYWHYKLFKWSLAVVDTWAGSKGKYVKKYAYGTTLSHYLRVMLLYMPLAVLSNLALDLWIFASLFVVPILAGGPMKYAAFLVILVLLGVILFCLGLFVKAWAASDNSILDLLLMNILDVRPNVKRREIGGFALFKRWLTSKFTGINPNVTFTEGVSNE